MTYNLSPKTVLRWQQSLNKLDGEEVLFRASDPHKMAYRMREAIAAAVHHKLKPYCDLAYRFTIKDDFVVARPKGRLVVRPIQVTRRYEDSLGDYEIVKIASKARESILEFPGYQGEVRAVELWCLTNGFEMVTEPYLILTREVEDGD